MNKQTIIIILFVLVAIAGSGISEGNLEEREPRKG